MRSEDEIDPPQFLSNFHTFVPSQRPVPTRRDRKSTRHRPAVDPPRFASDPSPTRLLDAAACADPPLIHPDSPPSLSPTRLRCPSRIVTCNMHLSDSEWGESKYRFNPLPLKTPPRGLPQMDVIDLAGRFWAGLVIFKSEHALRGRNRPATIP